MPRWKEDDTAPRAGPYTDSRQPQPQADPPHERHLDAAAQPFMPPAYPQPYPSLLPNGHYHAQSYSDPYGPVQQGWYGPPVPPYGMMPIPHAVDAMNWGPFQPSHPAFYPAPTHPAYPYPAPAPPGLGDHRDDQGSSAETGGLDRYHGYRLPGELYGRDRPGGGGMFRRDRWQGSPQQQQQHHHQGTGWASRGAGSRSPSPAPYGDQTQHRDPTGRAYYARQEDQFAAEAAANGGVGYAGPRNRRGPRHGRYSQKSRRFPSEYDEPTGPSEGEDGPYGFGFGGLQNISTAPAYAADGTYIPPERRQRRDLRTAIVSPPTPTYLAAADLPSTSGSSETAQGQQQQSEPVTLIMDLNHTLLCRAKRNRYASKMPVVRPYLSTFLTYICTTESTPSSVDTDADPAIDAPRQRQRRKFDPIVYSSARAPNVLSMLAALNLIPPARLAALPFRATYEPNPEEGDVLRMVFTREMMGLSEKDYHGDVETVKDLAKVWERLGWAGDGSKEGVAKEVGGEDSAAATAYAEAQNEVDAEPTEGEPRELATAAAIDATGATLTEPAAPPKKLNKKAKLRRATKRDTTGASRTLLLDDEAGKAAQQPFSHLPIAPFLLHPSEIPDPNAAAPPPLPPQTDADAQENGAQIRASSPPPLPSASAPRTPFYDSAAIALEVDSQHPPAHDKHLLATIWQLERLRFETNLAGALKGGALDRLKDEVRQAVIARRKDGTEGTASAAESTEGTAAAAEPTEDGDAVAEYEIADEMAQKGAAICRDLGIAVTREWVPGWRDTLLASRSTC